MKNCGAKMYEVIDTEDFMKNMVKCATSKSKSKETDFDFKTKVEDKALALIQAWGIVFKHYRRLPNFTKYYEKLLKKGVNFLPPNPEDLDIIPNQKKNQKREEYFEEEQFENQNKLNHFEEQPRLQNSRRDEPIIKNNERVTLGEVREILTLLFSMLYEMGSGDVPSKDEIISTLYNNLKNVQPKVIQLIQKKSSQDNYDERVLGVLLGYSFLIFFFY